jgi:hypothetical protein
LAAPEFPTRAADGPGPEADPGDVQVRVAKLFGFHNLAFSDYQMTFPFEVAATRQRSFSPLITQRACQTKIRNTKSENETIPNPKRHLRNLGDNTMFQPWDLALGILFRISGFRIFNLSTGAERESILADRITFFSPSWKEHAAQASARKRSEHGGAAIEPLACAAY